MHPIEQVLDICEAELFREHPQTTERGHQRDFVHQGAEFTHLRQMIPQIRAMLATEADYEYANNIAHRGPSREKLHRWLGFVQGAMWKLDAFIINEVHKIDTSAIDEMRARKTEHPTEPKDL